jgi:hypothetical protein
MKYNPTRETDEKKNIRIFMKIAMIVVTCTEKKGVYYAQSRNGKLKKKSTYKNFIHGRSLERELRASGSRPR